MENLPNNLRLTVAKLEGIELRRPENLYMHSTSESTQRLDRPTFDYFEDFSDDDDFATQCYIIDLKTELKEKDAQILKLQKKVDQLERSRAASWNFEVDFSD